MPKMRSIAVGIALFVLLLAPPLWACSQMGPNKHVGIVQKVDLKTGVFTIIDAETGKPLTFRAASRLLEALRSDSRVLITFKMVGDQLTAEEIHS